MKSAQLWTAVAAVMLIVLSGLGSAHAGSYSFNFNSVSAGANNGAIQTYMNGILGAAGSVALSGAKEANGYTGDGHAIGTCVGTTCTSRTLGTDDPGTDRFLITLQQTDSDTIKMQFTGLKLYSVTFDLEIFPDATCTSSTNCPNKPDFKFYSGNGGTTSLINTWYGAFPATGSHSPASGSTASEKSAQLIQTKWTYTNPNGFDTIWFQDWPATIGIDNLVINTVPQVPEPASLLLMGSGLLAVVRRRFAAKK